MPRLKLTQKAIERLPAPDPSGRPTLHWDSTLRGFGVLCSGKTSTKSYIVQRDLVGGRTRRVTVAATNVLPLDKARTEAQRILGDLYKGIDPKAGRRGAATVRDVLASYLAARKDLRPRTVEDYQRSIGYLGAWLDRPMREITAEMVQARHRSIAAEVQAQGRYSGESTANSAMRALRVLWNHLAEEVPDLPPNPVRRLRRQWYAERVRERLVRAEELPSFYRTVRELPNPVARDFLLLLLFTGLRRREAAGLTWEDIDLPARIIRLPATRTKAGRKFDLPMSDVVFGIFMERQRLGREKFVFPADSRSRHVEEPKFALNLVARATGIRVSSHDLRRTFVTTAESTDNISPIALKCLVNHSTGGGDVTAGYVIMTIERLREAAQRVADRLRVLCAIEPAGGNVQMLPLAAAAHRV